MNIKKKNDHGVFLCRRIAATAPLSQWAVLCVAASVAASLLPPLLLARVIDRLTAGLPLSFLAVLLYFGSLALEGVLTSAQESLLVLFGQRMTHALRGNVPRRAACPAGTLAKQNPGGVAPLFERCGHSRPVSFNIISMALSHLPRRLIMVITVKNTGRCAGPFLLVLPLFPPCLPVASERMLGAAAGPAAARSPRSPGRCPRPCTTSAPSGRWGWRITCHGAPV